MEYSPSVLIMRSPEGESLPADQRSTVSVISAAAQDLRPNISRLPYANGANQFDYSLAREKIRSLLWVAAENGHDIAKFEAALKAEIYDKMPAN